ncbi:MFS transporter [Sanguibacter sp. Z1732]|uniref:MFS transporter n=1 Tax=Sanguibacter sp. Z1732 TaxID=3435412 RepID=UPI003D9CB358
MRLLARDLVAAGIALQHLSFQFAALIGPAAAGVILGQWGLAPPYLVLAVAYLVALYAVMRLPAMPPTGGGSGRGVHAVVDGMRFIARRPVLRGLYATDLVATLLAMPIALFPMINEERFGGDPETLGLFLTAIGAGGVLAGLVSGTFTRSDRPGVVQLWAAGVSGARQSPYSGWSVRCGWRWPPWWWPVPPTPSRWSPAAPPCNWPPRTATADG